MWHEHGQDLIQRRGRWTLKVRRMRDGWDAVILFKDKAIWTAPRVWSAADEACAACAVVARELGLELAEVAG